MGTPIYIATLWGHSDTCNALLGSGANPLLKARACKRDWCRHGFPTEPGKPCPGYLNPEHPDDQGCPALQMAKNRGHTHIVRLMKHHILNCVVHDECTRFRKAHPEEFTGGLGRDPPRDDPILFHPAPVAQVLGDAEPPKEWPLQHFGRVFRAAEEGDVTLVKRLVREWNQAQELDEDVLNDGSEVPGSVKRPNPVEAKHPLTHESLLHVAAKQPRSAMVRFLLKCGANPLAHDRSFTCPIWHACFHGRFESAQLLAAKCSTKELRRPQGLGAAAGTTPQAAAAANKHSELEGWLKEEILRRLKNKGSDPVD